MDVLSRELEVGKETTEIFEGLAELIKDIKAGKEVGVIATENLPALITMIDGYDKIKDELTGVARNATLAYGSFALAEALAPVEVEGQ